MKSFKTFYKLYEGGKAVVDVQSIPQKDIPATLKSLESMILSKLKLKNRGVDWETLGSLGKKKADSGDIDVALNTLSIYDNNSNVKTTDDIISYITKILDKLNLKYKYMRGIGVFSTQFPIAGTDKKVQLDLMLTDNMEFTVWSFWSAKESETRFKKMGLYRNTLLQGIAHEMKTEITSTWDDGTPKEVKDYIFALDRGLYTRKYDYIGKKGQQVKGKQFRDRGIPTTNIQEIITMLLGNGATIVDTNTFETVWKRINHPGFPYKSKIDKIKKYAIKDFERKGMPVPEEIL